MKNPKPLFKMVGVSYIPASIVWNTLFIVYPLCQCLTPVLHSQPLGMFLIGISMMGGVEHPFVDLSTPCCLESLSKLAACLVIIWLQELFICSGYGRLHKYVICRYFLMFCGCHCGCHFLDDPTYPGAL